MRSKEYEAAFPYLRLSLYSSAILDEPNEIRLSASALFEYKSYNLSPVSDINDMYKTALSLVNGRNPENLKTKESVSVLTDYIRVK